MQLRAIESRGRLLEAALQLFVEKGYYKTNTKEIAKLAKVSIGSFYNYFKDKEEIYCELAEQYMQGSLQAVVDVFEKINQSNGEKSTAIALFVAYIDGQMERTIDSQYFFDNEKFVIQNNKKLQTQIVEANSKVSEAIQNFLMTNQHVKKRASYEVMTQMVFELANQLSKRVILTQETEIYQEYLDEMIAVIIYYIFGEEWKRELQGTRSRDDEDSCMRR